MRTKKERPQVLIVGRPNVGKSTLINRITGSKLAITAEESGVTRDVRSFEVDWNARHFDVLDSGGLILTKDVDQMQSKIESRVADVLADMDVILFITDVTTGIHTTDQTVAKYLRPFGDKVIVAANKTDNMQRRGDAAVFYKLGFGEPFSISAMQGNGIGDLLDEAISRFPVREVITASKDDEPEESLDAAEDGAEWTSEADFVDAPVPEEPVDVTEINVAIVGRPNMGKSSLMNALANREVSIVDEMAGTTRDVVDEVIQFEGKRYRILDTAGLRRKARVNDPIEYFSTLRASKTLAKADLVIVMLDATDGMTDQDRRIIGLVIENRRNMIVVVNKWDLLEERTDQMRKDLERVLKSSMSVLQYYPFQFVSALERHGLGRLLRQAGDITVRGHQRVDTATMNRFVDDIIYSHPPKAIGGKRLKIYYSTQAEISPPTFVFFVNEPRLATTEYRRFIERQIRSYLGDLEGCAIRIKFRGKSEKSRR